jgi:prephenate dehydrogenase
VLIQRITIIGTGLIGTSVGLALRSAGFTGTITGADADAAQADTALQMHAVTEIVRGQEKTLASAANSGVVVLAVPVSPSWTGCRSSPPS